MSSTRAPGTCGGVRSRQHAKYNTVDQLSAMSSSGSYGFASPSSFCLNCPPTECTFAPAMCECEYECECECECVSV